MEKEGSDFKALIQTLESQKKELQKAKDHIKSVDVESWDKYKARLEQTFKELEADQKKAEKMLESVKRMQEIASAESRKQDNAEIYVRVKVANCLKDAGWSEVFAKAISELLQETEKNPIPWAEMMWGQPMFWDPATEAAGGDASKFLAAIGSSRTPAPRRWRRR